MLIDDLDNVEKEGPAISYISESEDSRIIVIDSTYFNENKLITKEYNGEKIEIKENPALVDCIIKRILKTNEPQIKTRGRDETNATATVYTNVYAGPSKDIYASIGSIDMGESIVVIGESLGWYHIRYFITKSNQEKMGYVPKSYIAYIGSTGGEEDFYGEFCYAKAKTTIRSTQNFADSVKDFGTVGQYEGMTLLYSYEYFGNVISFVEYSTSNGTKRGYVYESDIQKPLSNKSCVLIANTKKTVYSGPDSGYANIGAIGNTELAVILAKEGNWLYIEYNTTGGRKRGYITIDSITYYHRPNSFPDFIRTTYSGSVDQNAWVTNKETVYGGPNTTYANIGAVNDEAIINYKTNSGSNEPLTYIEYWITGSSTKKCGYISTSSIISKDPSIQPEERHLTTITKTYSHFSTREVYGQTQRGRDMYYYKAGNGPKHMFLIFAHHGWEDSFNTNGKYFAGDGDCLIRIAQNFIERFENTNASEISNILSNWSIYVFPGINLDGIVEGVGVGYNKPNLGDNGGFGRCLANNLDPNRNWACNFEVVTSTRNKTASIPFQAIELQNLRDCLRNNRSTTKNVLLDIHGWFNQTVGNEALGSYFWNSSNMDLSKSNSNGKYGKGYLIGWAHNPTSYSTDANSFNQSGLDADACLIELKDTRDHSIDMIENNYGLKFYNTMMDILKNYNGTAKK